MLATPLDILGINVLYLLRLYFVLINVEFITIYLVFQHKKASCSFISRETCVAAFEIALRNSLKITFLRVIILCI